MTSKRMSFILDHRTVNDLKTLTREMGGSYTDTIHIAIARLKETGAPKIVKRDDTALFEQIKQKLGCMSISEWCTIKLIDERYLRALCRRLDKGHKVIGFSDVEPKTHSAYIARLLETELHIRVEGSNYEMS